MSLEDLIPFGMETGDFIVTLAAVAAVLTVLALWMALVPNNTMAKRARQLLAHRAALREDALAPKRRRSSETAMSLMRTVVSKLKLMKSHSSEALNMKLSRGGIRSADAPVKFMFAKIALPIVFVGVAVFAVYIAELYELSGFGKMLAVIGAGLLGYFGPDIYVYNRASKRKQSLQKGLPDALDLLVICAEAGLHLDSAINRVADEMSLSNPDLAEELALTSVELSFLPERRKALDNLAQRTGLAAMRALVNTLMQTEKYGTPLAHSLRILAAELRNERLMKAEEKAARLPAVLTVPMIIFILPPLFIVLLAPSVLNAIDAIKDVF